MSSAWADAERELALERQRNGDYRHTAAEVAGMLDGRTRKAVEKLRERAQAQNRPEIPEPPRREPRRYYPPFNPFMQPAAVFDIETTDFGAVGRNGFLLCCSILELEADAPYTIQLEFGAPNDKGVLQDTIDALSQYRLLVGHNIAAFDLGWLNTRRIFHNLPILPHWRYIDTLTLAKDIAIKARNKKLATLVDFYGVEGIKTGVYEAEWSESRSTFREEFEPTMAAIVYHCEQDVLANRQVFLAMWPDAIHQHKSPIKRTKW